MHLTFPGPVLIYGREPSRELPFRRSQPLSIVLPFMKKELWLGDRRLAIGANLTAVYASSDEWFYAAPFGQRSRRTIGKEVGYRHNVRRCRIRPTESIDPLPLLIVVSRGLLLIHFGCFTVYCLRQLPLSHWPLRIDKSLFLALFDPLSVCLCEYPIHRRSSRRLFIASSVAAGPLYKLVSVSTFYQYLSFSHTGSPCKEDYPSPLSRPCNQNC